MMTESATSVSSELSIRPTMYEDTTNRSWATPQDGTCSSAENRSALWLLLLILISSQAAAQGPWTIDVDSPGVYRFSHDDLVETSDSGVEALASRTLVLSHLGREQPLWLLDGDDGSFGPGDSAAFVVTRTQLRSPDKHPATSLHPLVLSIRATTASGVGARSTPPRPTAEQTKDAGRAEFRRVWHFEEDRVRAPLTAADHRVPTMWFWTVLSQRESSSFELSLGDIETSVSPDRDGATIDISVGLLGWSVPRDDLEVAQHHVDMLIDGRKVGDARWDGRTLDVLQVSVPAATIGPGSKLTLKVPKRWRADPAGDDEPIIDVVYLDRIEILQPIGQLQADSDQPLRVGASDHWRWLPNAQLAPSTLLAIKPGLTEARDGRFWLPPASVDSDVWIADHQDAKRPVAIRSARDTPRSTGANYLIIAPTPLLESSQRLAEIHRQRGFDVAVIDSSTVYDSFGHGYESPSALRQFLLRHADAAQLEYVLLIGDTNWYSPDDAEQRKAGTDRHRLVSPIYLSEFGPAASDHLLVADEAEITEPVAAIGRLPVANGADLATAINKIEHFLDGPKLGPEAPTILLSDQTGPSQGRHRRLVAKLESSGHALELPLDGTDIEDPSAAVVAAINRNPAAVFFAGHGSRHAWQLGSSEGLDETFFFGRNNLPSLQPDERPPFFVSISCATAPFDHPSASSLGELSTLLPGAGAIAFVGASVRLYTPPRFGQTILDDLRDGRSIGQAFVRAKTLMRSERVSLAYNLIGDPSLGLYSDRER